MVIHRYRLAAAMISLALVGVTTARATEVEEPAPAATAGSGRAGSEQDRSEQNGAGVGGVSERKQAREAELEAIRRSIEVSTRRQDALREEISSLDHDRQTLSADLIATAQRLRQAEDHIRDIEARLDQMHSSADNVRRSLAERRSVMAEVLMALQRMGRTPPPAILSRPEDALAAIRGSILAGAVLPDIRVEAESLAADLGELTRLTARIQAERDELAAGYTALGEEQTRIDLLVATKQAQREQTAAALSAEQGKATELAGQAQTLQALIKNLEKDVAAAARAAREAEQAKLTPPPADRQEARRRLADTSRIAPALHFADAQGLLTLPVSGRRLIGFGDPDEFGGHSQGLSFATRPGTQVLAPADGWVAYSGPFRSYGQVLILNAGDDYHIVLTGMERVNVVLGQFVLAGEPVAVMGDKGSAGMANVEHTSAQPVLYVEFRKNGNAIDSAPWWARTTDGEVNG